jgi:hypothetical protein
LAEKTWWDLAPAKAQEFADSFAEEYPDRAADFVEEVSASAQRPTKRLDYSFSSLSPAWSWFLEDASLPGRFRKQRWDLSEGPFWAEFVAPLASPLGRDLCWKIHGLASYVVAAIAVELDDVSFFVDPDEESGRYNKVLVAVGGGKTFDPLSLLVLTRRALGLASVHNDLKKQARASTAIQDLPLWSDAPARGTEYQPDWDVEQVKPRSFVVTFSDRVAFDRSADVDSLVDALAALSTVDSAVRSDREVVTVQGMVGQLHLAVELRRHLA